MKRLRAESSWASWRCMSSSARASEPSSSGLSTTKCPEKSPAATRSAARSRRRMRRDSARATNMPARIATSRAGMPASRIWRRTTATLSATSLSGAEKTTTRATRPS